MSEASHEIREQPARTARVVRPERRVPHRPDEEGHDEEARKAGRRENHKLADEVPAAGWNIVIRQVGVGGCGFQ